MKHITASDDAITVITITRGRLRYLERAIGSVKNQDSESAVMHYVVIDDCRETLDFLEQTHKGDPSLYWEYYCRRQDDFGGPALLARLRTMAIRKAETEWIAFLDDDNEYCPDHLSKLLAYARQHNGKAVHSYREILYRNGQPYLEPEYPWGRTPADSKRKYNEMRDAGVIVPNSNVYRDKLGFVIDTNTWLLSRDLFVENEISDYFDTNDWRANIAEDDKLMYMLQEKGIPVLTNQIPSVKYYLGGYSNVFDGSVEGTVVWEEKGLARE